MRLTLDPALSEDDWNTLRSRALSCTELPDWARQVLRQDFTSLARGAGSGAAYVTCEFVPTTDSYLEFLREQVSLNARGAEWTAVLLERLRKLAPHRGRTLLRLSVGSDGAEVTLRFDPDTYALIHCEN